MRTSTKVLLILTVLSLAAMFFVGFECGRKNELDRIQKSLERKFTPPVAPSVVEESGGVWI